MRSQKHPKIQFFLNLIKTCKSCSRLGESLVLEVGLGPKRHVFRGLFESSLDATLKNENYWKMTPKWYPKGWGDFGAGATGCTFGAPVCFWTQKVYPKCSKNNLKGAKVTPKCFKSDPQGRKMHSYRSAKVVQVHQKMSAARYQARRTARSAFNKLLDQFLTPDIDY